VTEKDGNILRLEELLEWLERAQERIAVALNQLVHIGLNKPRVKL
jgi:hypothetical protein